MKKLFITLLLLSIVFSIFAQKSDSTITNKKFKHIRFQPFQLLYNELAINIEIPVSNRFDISFGGGYIKNSNSGNENTFSSGNGSASRYSIQNFLNPFLSSYKIDFGIKYYLSKQRDFFINFNPYYRKWWLDNTWLSYDDNLGYKFIAKRTERVNVFGAKLVLGSNIDVFSSNHFSLNVTPYIGIGYRYKIIDYQSVGMVNDVLYYETSPYIEKFDDWYVTPQLGFMCGLGIR